MAKSLSFLCTNCQQLTHKWAGQCPNCEAWNTLVEYADAEVDFGHKKVTSKKAAKDRELGVLESVSELQAKHTSSHDMQRFVTGMEECDRVFGGGIAEGSISLLAGEPGIGKSTLTLELARLVAAQRGPVVYVSGEESVSQIASRAKRLGIKTENLLLLNENCIETALATALPKEPSFLIIDSIQVMYSENASGNPGNIAQIRFVAEILMEVAKSRGVTVLLIGHVTKEGTLAGPRVLEHLVDTVLILEGERSHTLRLLRTEKNRFGATDEVGVFSMTEKGLEEVTNPSEAFLSERSKGSPGSVVTATLEGTRSFLVEVQALTSYTKFGYPKRTAVGFDLNRLQLLLAVLGKFTKVNLDSDDVYINVVGGLRIRETGLDVAMLLAIISSKLGKPVPADLIAFGEVGLTGEIRSLGFLEKRMKEAEKLGMRRFMVPAGAALPKLKDVEIIQIRHVGDVMKVFS